MILNLILLQTEQSGGLSSILMFVVLIAVFYFFMIRPQQKKQKEINKFRQNLQKGSKIITAGGIHGVIADIAENYFVVSITDNVKIRVDKGSVYPSAADAAESNIAQK